MEEITLLQISRFALEKNWASRIAIHKTRLHCACTLRTFSLSYVFWDENLCRQLWKMGSKYRLHALCTHAHHSPEQKHALPIIPAIYRPALDSFAGTLAWHTPIPLPGTYGDPSEGTPCLGQSVSSKWVSFRHQTCLRTRATDGWTVIALIEHNYDSPPKLEKGKWSHIDRILSCWTLLLEDTDFKFSGR